MATPSWQVAGQYYETCSCDFVCPCILGQMAVRPSRGTCTFAMGFQIEGGTYDSVSLSGLGFIVLGLTPEAMGNGNWSVGLIIDERASAEQRDALTAIATGAAGGPMAALSGLIGKFLGVESARSTSIAAASNGPLQPRHSLIWLPRVRWELIRPPPSPCISITLAILPRIHWRSRTHQRATCTRSV